MNSQEYLNSISLFNNQSIDVDLNFFREMPFNIIFHSIDGTHLTGVPINMVEKFLNVNILDNFKDKIAIVRSHRYRNDFINYKFLSKSKNLIFLG